MSPFTWNLSSTKVSLTGAAGVVTREVVVAGVVVLGGVVVMGGANLDFRASNKDSRITEQAPRRCEIGTP